MPEYLKEAKLGWKGLGLIINRIIARVNHNTPLAGDGILITEGPGGMLIATAAAKNSGEGGSQGDKRLQALRTNTLVWVGVKWEDVIVVDPDTCDQSVLKVLVYTGNAADAVYMNLGAAQVAPPP